MTKHFKIHRDIYKHIDNNMYYLSHGRWYDCGSQGTYTEDLVKKIGWKRNLTEKEMEKLVLDMI